ncbi:transmembrane 9 superfamily member, partial [Haematococcus lacustris]
MREMLVALLAFGLVFAADAFYLPGVAPQDFKRKDVMYLKVNKLSSIKNQLPYEYYSLPYCRPEKIVQSAENLGEVLRGDRIENSLYQIQMRVDEQCKFLCRIDSLSSAQAKAFRLKIEDDYRDPGQPTCRDGENAQRRQEQFACKDIRARVSRRTDLARIVGFEVEPFSVKHEYEAPWDKASPVLNTCNPGRAISVTHDTPPQPVLEGTEAIFTYDVRFVASDIRWASRWDTYLLMIDDQIHWFSIINSVMIVLFLTGMVAVIMLRVLRRDISNYNQLESGEDAQEETGWKLVHGDVFRPPAAGSILASYVGTGVQLFGMALVTMIFALLGFLSPANRGGLMTAMLMMFVFMGMFAGYFSARLYKSFRGEEWKKTTLRTALLFPVASLQQKDGPGWWSLLVVTDLSWLWPYDVTSVACMQQKDGTKAGGHGSGPA